MRRPSHPAFCMLLLLSAVEAFSFQTTIGINGKRADGALWNKQSVALRSTGVDVDMGVESAATASYLDSITTGLPQATTGASTGAAVTSYLDALSVGPVAVPSTDGATAPVGENPSPKQPNRQSSRALESMLKLNNGMTIPEFFQSLWQQSPALFRGSTTNNACIQSESNGAWKGDRMKSQPYEELVKEGWSVLTDLLEQPIVFRDPQNPNEQQEPPLVIQNGNVQHPQEWMPAYGTPSLFAPQLNGASVNQAHADWLSPWLAAFCLDLQRTFPYVYANTYLTPPHSRALDLHADDRDVFVVQLVGSKEWEIMQEVPIPYPYHHEQVGKGDLQVPLHVVEGGCSLATTLQAGDVLYIPRGHCHHARCTDDLSFHVTIAVPTFDWTLAGMLHAASQNILTNVDDYRKGILPLEALDAHNPREALQKQIDSAMVLLHQMITPEAVLNSLQARTEPHRQRAAVQREGQLERALSVTTSQSVIPVGPLAAKHIALSTKVRAATATEQEQLQELLRRAPYKLKVRDELAEDVSSILSLLQFEPTLESPVSKLGSLLSSSSGPSPVWCDLAWLGFAKLAVELGELAVVDPEDS